MKVNDKIGTNPSLRQLESQAGLSGRASPERCAATDAYVAPTGARRPGAPRSGSLKRENYTMAWRRLEGARSGLAVEVEITQPLAQREITIDGTTYSDVPFAFPSFMNQAGAPDVGVLRTPFQTQDSSEYEIVVTDVKYREEKLLHPFRPATGPITRDRDPATVPVRIDPGTYDGRSFPFAEGEFVKRGNHFRIRDVRGVEVEVAPVVINPKAGTVKMLEKIQIELRPKPGTRGSNTVPETNGRRPSVLRENLDLFKTLFPNFRWEHEISDDVGDMIVIHTARDAAPMSRYAEFRRKQGFAVHTREVERGTDVQSLIKEACAENPKIMYVLLAGDWEDVKGARNGTDPADTAMGMVAGDDNYLDVAIGRLSGENATHIATQVDKIITYEQTPLQPWHAAVLGIGSAEGAGNGDDQEADKQHIDIILENKFKPRGYVTLHKVYDPGAKSSDVAAAIDGGVGMAFYTGHGSDQKFVTSGYGVSDVRTSKNGDKTPVVISVACVNGDFDSKSCFAEALQRKQGGGSVSTLMSTINQSWRPPMIGQDYIADMLTGGYDYTNNPGNGTNTDHGKTRLGSAIFSAMNLWCAESGTADDIKNMKTWHLFGDPALNVKSPKSRKQSTKKAEKK